MPHFAECGIGKDVLCYSSKISKSDHRFSNKSSRLSSCSRFNLVKVIIMALTIEKGPVKLSDILGSLVSAKNDNLENGTIGDCKLSVSAIVVQFLL